MANRGSPILLVFAASNPDEVRVSAAMMIKIAIALVFMKKAFPAAPAVA
jgi:hypothetical protein